MSDHKFWDADACRLITGIHNRIRNTARVHHRGASNILRITSISKCEFRLHTARTDSANAYPMDPQLFIYRLGETDLCKLCCTVHSLICGAAQTSNRRDENQSTVLLLDKVRRDSAGEQKAALEIACDQAFKVLYCRFCNGFVDSLTCVIDENVDLAVTAQSLFHREIRILGISGISGNDMTLTADRFYFALNLGEPFHSASGCNDAISMVRQR